MTKVWKHWNLCRKWSGPSLNKLVFLLNPSSWETWASSSCLDGEALDLWESISWAKWRVKHPNWQRAVELFRTPHCPSRWSWARWFTGRGWGAWAGVCCGRRAVRRVCWSVSCPPLDVSCRGGALPSPDRCADWEGFQVQGRKSGQLTPCQDLLRQIGK